MIWPRKRKRSKTNGRPSLAKLCVVWTWRWRWGWPSCRCYRACPTAGHGERALRRGLGRSPASCVHRAGNPRPDAQRDVIAGEVGERRRCWIVRRRLIREAVAGLHHLSSCRGDQGLTVAEVAGQLVGVPDPGPMLLIEHHPIDGEALRDELVAVDDEQAPTVMCVVVAASLARPPDAAPYRRPEPQRRSAASGTRATKLETGSIPRPPGGGWSSRRDAPGRRARPPSVAPPRRARRPPNRKGRAGS